MEKEIKEGMSSDTLFSLVQSDKQGQSPEETEEGKAPHTDDIYSDGLDDDNPYTDEEDLEEIPEWREDESEKKSSSEKTYGDRVGAETAKKQARVFIQTIDFLSSRVFAIYGGNHRDTYKMDDGEKEELVENAAAWMEASEVEIDPGTMFFISLATILGYNAWKAHQDRVGKEEAERSLKIVDSKLKSERTPEEEALIKKIKTNSVRNQFKMDKQGFYFYDEAGNYIRGSANRTEKAPQLIANVYRKAKELGYTEARLNDLCKEAIETGMEPDYNKLKEAMQNQ